MKIWYTRGGICFLFFLCGFLWFRVQETCGAVGMGYRLWIV